VALDHLAAEGMTVEGWESAEDIGRIAREHADVGALPYLDQVHRVLFEGAPAASLLDLLKG
jgi:glycerol-3-phosphate dehydrogenase